MTPHLHLATHFKRHLANSHTESKWIQGDQALHLLYFNESNGVPCLVNQPLCVQQTIHAHLHIHVSFVNFVCVYVCSVWTTHAHLHIRTSICNCVMYVCVRVWCVYRCSCVSVFVCVCVCVCVCTHCLISEVVLNTVHELCSAVARLSSVYIIFPRQVVLVGKARGAN